MHENNEQKMTGRASLNFPNLTQPNPARSYQTQPDLA